MSVSAADSNNPHAITEAQLEKLSPLVERATRDWSALDPSLREGYRKIGLGHQDTLSDAVDMLLPEHANTESAQGTIPAALGGAAKSSGGMRAWLRGLHTRGQSEGASRILALASSAMTQIRTAVDLRKERAALRALASLSTSDLRGFAMAFTKEGKLETLTFENDAIAQRKGGDVLAELNVLRAVEDEVLKRGRQDARNLGVASALGVVIVAAMAAPTVLPAAVASVPLLAKLGFVAKAASFIVANASWAQNAATVGMAITAWVSEQPQKESRSIAATHRGEARGAQVVAAENCQRDSAHQQGRARSPRG